MWGGKIYARIIEDRFCRVTEGPTDDEQWGFKSGRVRRSDLHSESREKKDKVYVGFVVLDKVYDRPNREALW